MTIHDFITKVKRAETPFYARLKRIAKAVFVLQVPIPRALDPVYGFIAYMRYLKYEFVEKLAVVFYRYPVLRSLCASVGERLRMEQVPSIVGPAKVYIGDDVYLSGRLTVFSARIFSSPEFRIGNRTFIGSSCSFSVAKLIEIGDDVLIASGCSVSDYSGHPVDPDLRVAGAEVSPEDVRPVRIGNKVWLGRGAIVLPGVTIGDAAVIGAGAVVTKDVPPGHICVGNPGRLLARTVYEARTAARPLEEHGRKLR